MKTIKMFTVGDKVPDDAQCLGQQHYVDFKGQRRIAEFFFLVPVPKASRSRR